MNGASLSLELPLRTGTAGLGELFAFLGPVDDSGALRCLDALSLRSGASNDFCIGFAGPDAILTRVPIPDEAGGMDLEIAPGLTLIPAPLAGLHAFLRGHDARVDHLGVNLSHLALSQRNWTVLIENLARRFAVYRLQLEADNEIVIVLFEDGAALELVYDRASCRSSFHACLAVTAERAEVERVFAFPSGGYKVGDEAFFRSVALPVASCFPCYVDIAFADGKMMPWRAIVKAMGKRIAG